MVTITDFKKRENTQGKEFIVLVLEGDLELVKSQESKQYYATVRRTTIASTLSEAVSSNLVGKTLPGTIEKVETKPYDYMNRETGEVIQLDFTFRYNPNGKSLVEESEEAATQEEAEEVMEEQFNSLANFRKAQFDSLAYFYMAAEARTAKEAAKKSSFKDSVKKMRRARPKKR